MNQPLLMRIVQSPGKLDRDVQNSYQRLFRATFVERAVADPLGQAPAFHVLGEHARNAAQVAHVVATYDVRV